jgi:hypothetical protein
MTTELEEVKCAQLNEVRSQAYIWFIFCFYLIVRIAIAYKFKTDIGMPLPAKLFMLAVVAGAIGSILTFISLTYQLTYLKVCAKGILSIFSGLPISWRWKYWKVPVFCAVVFEVIMLGRWLVMRG